MYPAIDQVIDAQAVRPILFRYGLHRDPTFERSLLWERGRSSSAHAIASLPAGLGMAVVPAPLATLSLPHLVYRPIKEKEMTGDLLLLSRAGETRGAVRAFLLFARRTP